ncbi:MAG: hypothetical protein D6721_08290 [Gammaproteobacteria bacterium]|nr:MAG: hypothetical protein D6721_08290 [Gammaproteobacteria bacterium]
MDAARRRRITGGVLGLLCLAAAGCVHAPGTPPGISAPVHRFSEVPLRDLRADPRRWIGTRFEGRLKYYRLYHGPERARPGSREQVVRGKTHFTARPLEQMNYVIQVLVTPAQEAWLRAHHVQRQDTLWARLEFTGLAPGEALAFRLLEVHR